MAVGISSGVQEGATDSRHVDVPATVADAVQTVGKSVVKILDAADGVGGLGPWLSRNFGRQMNDFRITFCE